MNRYTSFFIFLLRHSIHFCLIVMCDAFTFAVCSMFFVYVQLEIKTTQEIE